MSGNSHRLASEAALTVTPATRARERRRNRSNRLPLWALIVIPFAVLIAAAMGVTAWISLLNARAAVDELAVELNKRITASIIEHVNAFAEAPMLFLEVGSAPYRWGRQDLSDYDSLQRAFYRQLRLNSDIDGLYFANDAGHFVMAKAGEPPVGLLRDDSTAPYRHIFHLDENGNRTQLVGTQEYDPRVRPWYATAVKAGTAAWSPVYVFAAEPVLGVSPTLPLYDEAGALRGVFAADLTLSGIANFLRRLEISPRGEAFIFERSGAIIASSSEEPPFLDTPTGRERLFALDSREPIIRQTAQALRDRLGGFERIVADRQITYERGGESHFVQVAVLRNEKGLDWLMAVTIPASDFMGPIEATARSSMLLAGGALLLAIALGVVTARWVTRPLRSFAAASRAIAEGELDQRIEVESVQEVKHLGEAFNRMAQELKVSFRELEAANAELEDRVQRRTTTLSQQMERERALVAELDSANRKLEKLATTDSLTQVANRGRFETLLEREWARLAREGAGLSLIVCDIDFFKDYNDAYGHLAGDECLRKVAGAIKEAVQRPSDLVARYGGEEFAVLLPKTDRGGAMKVAHGIQSNLTALDITHASSMLSDGRVTISIGVACTTPRPDASPTELVRRADGALYEAKQAGRDRIVIAGESGGD